MITLILAAIHGFATNKDFRPDILYFGTIILDIALIVEVGPLLFSC